jgi:hypothetical protein
MALSIKGELRTDPNAMSSAAALRPRAVCSEVGGAAWSIEHSEREKRVSAASRGTSGNFTSPSFQLKLFHALSQSIMDPSNTQDFSLITTIRYDPLLRDAPGNVGSPWQLLPFHLARLRNSAANLGWEAASESLSGARGERLFYDLCTEAVKKHQTVEDEPVAVCAIPPC